MHLSRLTSSMVPAPSFQLVTSQTSSVRHKEITTCGKTKGKRHILRTRHKSVTTCSNLSLESHRSHSTKLKQSFSPVGPEPHRPGILVVRWSRVVSCRPSTTTTTLPDPPVTTGTLPRAGCQSTSRPQAASSSSLVAAPSPSLVPWKCPRA